ncbi:MAG TPA: UDP-glucose 4-epimerase GalE [Bacteroidia bacterium]|nr:UDP-glucose 4-epimerase GalE [Bacteroidia bacterium]
MSELTKHILVTGGTGYIGSHTTVELLQEGYRVTIADDLSNSRAEVVDAVGEITGKRPAFVNVDLCNKDAVDALFKANSFDAIIHFAAHKQVGESVTAPLKYYRNNLTGLINLVEASLTSGTTRMVFSSSCTVYGQPDRLPVDENSPVRQPESPYGNTKKIAEEILRDAAAAYAALKVISLRYFNPVGAHNSSLIGEYPIGPPQNLMPVLTQLAIGKRNSMEVFGDDYNTPDGSCIRDYIHVVDLAKAHVVAIRRLLSASNSDAFETFNLGTGKGLSVLEVIRAFEEVNGVKLNYRISGRRPGDVEQIYGSTEKANTVLGWKAELNLNEMVKSAWAWEKMLDKKEKSKNTASL